MSVALSFLPPASPVFATNFLIYLQGCLPTNFKYYVQN